MLGKHFFVHTFLVRLISPKSNDIKPVALNPIMSNLVVIREHTSSLHSYALLFFKTFAAPEAFPLPHFEHSAHLLGFMVVIQRGLKQLLNLYDTHLRLVLRGQFYKFTTD